MEEEEGAEKTEGDRGGGGGGNRQTGGGDRNRGGDRMERRMRQRKMRRRQSRVDQMRLQRQHTGMRTFGDCVVMFGRRDHRIRIHFPTTMNTPATFSIRYTLALPLRNWALVQNGCSRKMLSGAGKQENTLGTTAVRPTILWTAPVPPPTRQTLTNVQHEFADGAGGGRVDGGVLGIEVVVHDGGHQDVDHLRHVVLQQPHDLLQGLQGVQVHLAVGLLQARFEGIKHLEQEQGGETVNKTESSRRR